MDLLLHNFHLLSCCQHLLKLLDFLGILLHLLLPFHLQLLLKLLVFFSMLLHLQLQRLSCCNMLLQLFNLQLAFCLLIMLEQIDL